MRLNERDTRKVNYGGFKRRIEKSQGDNDFLK